MKRGSIFVAFAAVAFTVIGCQPQAGPLSDEDVAAIGDLGDAYAQAVLAGDAAAMAALYTENVVEMPPNAPAVVGRAATQAGSDETPETATAFALTPLETDGRDGLAYSRGTYSVTVTVEGMEEPITDTGKYLVICEKQPDGSWLMARVIWNSDLPLPEQP